MIKRKQFTGGQHAGNQAQAVAKKRLPLHLQFFADKPEGDDKGDNKGGDNPDDKNKGGNPNPDPDDDPDDDKPLTLRELMKADPEIRKQVDAEKEKAVKRRFRNLAKDNPDNNDDPKDKKKPEGDGGSDDESKKWASKASKLEARVKESAVAAYAASEGYNPELVKALAASKIDKLELDDDGNIDKDDLLDVMDELESKFPDVFTKKETKKVEDEEPNKSRRKSHSRGPSTQRTNESAKDDAKQLREQTAARVERLKKRKYI